MASPTSRGRSQVGKRADLLLLSANPLTDISNTSSIVGVAAGGAWYGGTQLTQLKETARVAITAPLPAEPVVKPASATKAPDDEQEVLAVVQRLFDAMRTKDTAAMRQVFDSQAVLVGMRPGKDGAPPHVQRITAAEFAAFVARDTASGSGPSARSTREVRMSGTLATVWAEYDFHFGQTFSHCGVDAVQLLKTARWVEDHVDRGHVRAGGMHKSSRACRGEIGLHGLADYSFRSSAASCARIESTPGLSEAWGVVRNSR